MAFLENQLPWLASSPLNLQGIPYEVPYEALRWIPRFGNNGNISAQEHLFNFSHALTSLAIAHEDVAVKLLVHSFEGPAAEWFQSLPPGSISSWVDITIRFKRAFPENLDPQTLIDEFCKMRKHVHEFVNDFNVRFRKAFMQIPEDFRPHDRLALQIYYNALDPHLSYAVRREKPYTLFDAMNVTIEIEQEMISSRLIPIPFSRQHSAPPTETTSSLLNNFTFKTPMQFSSPSCSALPLPPSPPFAYQNHNSSHDALVTELNGIHETMENLNKEIIALQLETQQGDEDMKPYQNQNLASPPNVTPTPTHGVSFNFPRFVPGRAKRKEGSRVKQSRQQGINLDPELSGNTSVSTETPEDETSIDDRDAGVPRMHVDKIDSSDVTDVECQEDASEISTIDSSAINARLIDTSTSRNDTCQNDYTQNEIDPVSPYCEVETDRDDSHGEVGIRDNSCFQATPEIDHECEIPCFETFHFDDNTKTEQSSSEDKILSSVKGTKPQNSSDNINPMDGNKDPTTVICERSLHGNTSWKQNVMLNDYLSDNTFHDYASCEGDNLASVSNPPCDVNILAESDL